MCSHGTVTPAENIYGVHHKLCIKKGTRYMYVYIPYKIHLEQVIKNLVSKSKILKDIYFRIQIFGACMFNFFFFFK